MFTFVLIQVIFAAISFSLGSLYAYHLPNLAAQVIVFVYNVFPFERIRLIGLAGLGLAGLSSAFCFIIAFIRAWRYIFFPSKEHLNFFLQCLGLIPCLVIQLVFFLYQYRQLSQKKRPKYLPKLYMNAVYIMFIHDFIYATLFIYTGSWYVMFGYTQFVVHSAMTIIGYENARSVVKYYCLLWAALLVQHVFTISQFFADKEPFNSWFVLIFSSVYIVANTLYILNATLLYANDR